MNRARVTLAVLAGAAGVALVIGGAAALRIAEPPPVVALPTTTIVHSVYDPDEAPTDSACAEHTAASGEPRHVALPSIGADGCVVNVGIDQHDRIAVPGNIHLAGWFVDSVAPGGRGNSILVGHVVGRTGGGIFERLRDLRAGDTVRVELGAGDVREFVVRTVDSYRVAETAAEQFRQLDGVERQLTLITCGGAYDADAAGYDHRVVVRAEAVAP